MKAILNEDKIVYFSERESAVEIGEVPYGVGLERLRFDGTQVVDLADLSAFWVRQIGPRAFEFHAVEVPNSQYVEMAWADRKRLINDAGTIRVMTQSEIDEWQAEKQRQTDVVQQYNDRTRYNNLLKQFITATPNQIQNYIDNNVTDLASAKQVLTEVAVIVRYMAEKMK